MCIYIDIDNKKEIYQVAFQDTKLLNRKNSQIYSQFLTIKTTNLSY